MGRAATVVATVALLAALTGCAEATAPSDKPVTLTLTTYDKEGTPGAALVHHFIDEVTSLDPSISITPSFRGSPEEPDAVNAVATGSSDLAMVASRAFDSAGVTTLEALNTPFLIDSNPLANALATSDAVPRLLAGLDDIGVIGLGLAPEGLRHPFGATKAPVAVSDLDGVIVHAPQSQVVWSMLTATGATPNFDDAITYSASESQFDLTLNNHAAGNVTFFAKFDVLALNRHTAQRLTSRQLAAIRRAATESTTWAIANTEDDAAMAADFCARGGTIAAATRSQLAAWNAAVQPVTDALRSVPSTAALIDAITVMKTALPPTAPVTGCVGTTPGRVHSRLNGVYTYTLTVRQLRAAGVADQTFIDENAGPFEVTFTNGSLTARQTYVSGPKKGQHFVGVSTYTLAGDRITFLWSTQPNDYTSATVTVLHDGSLEFSDFDEGQPEPRYLILDRLAMRHWQKVR